MDLQREDAAFQAEYSYPHCDARILHAPGCCEYCDHYPDRQLQRVMDGVAFTGQTPEPGQQPCPADAARPPGADNDHRRWGGNRPTSSLDDPDWPEETYASLMLYGPPWTRLNEDALAYLASQRRSIGSHVRQLVRQLWQRLRP